MVASSDAGVRVREKPKIVVAGASGFVGQGIPEGFEGMAKLVGLSRAPERAAVRAPGYQEWRRCDLFSRRESQEAMEGADLVIYLVHSMVPSARLTQGTFRDMDLICADNFARAARDHGVERILYVGELVPQERWEEEGLPEHLKSRLEVEAALGAYGAQVLALRPGIVLGPGAAITEGLRRLIHRLPVMVLPGWARSKIAPIARRDLVRLLRYGMEIEGLKGSYDVGGPEEVTYARLLAMAAEMLGKRRRFVQSGLSLPAVSTAWVSLFTGRPREAVASMIRALERDLLPDDRGLQERVGLEAMGVEEAMRASLVSEEQGLVKPPTSRALSKRRWAKEVRSVQRLPLPGGRSARWVAEEYARWLPAALRPLIAVDRRIKAENGASEEEVVVEEELKFRVRPFPFAILKLRLDRDVSHPDRHLFWISGGVLVRPHDPGRLEFRTVLGEEYCLAAIHQFRPRLPWFVYRATQAWIHGVVMHAFGRYLGEMKERLPPGE